MITTPFFINVSSGTNMLAIEAMQMASIPSTINIAQAMNAGTIVMILHSGAMF